MATAIQRLELGTNGPEGDRFSDARPSSLVLLAERSPVVSSVRGESVASAFERLVALEFESMGVTMVRSKPGQAAPDMIGLTSSGHFILDAKTFRKPYALPAKDHRAMCQYVRDTRNTLSKCGPFRLALVVGPSGARTLERRLTLLECDIGLPVRYLTATQLWRLRTACPYPVRDDILVGYLVASRRRVVCDEVIGRIIETTQRERHAYQRLVETMFESFAVSGAKRSGQPQVPSPSSSTVSAHRTAPYLTWPRPRRVKEA
jgi:hypothetical protein